VGGDKFSEGWYQPIGLMQVIGKEESHKHREVQHKQMNTINVIKNHSYKNQNKIYSVKYNTEGKSLKS
jgi:hypothetical protein